MTSVAGDAAGAAALGLGKIVDRVGRNFGCLDERGRAGPTAVPVDELRVLLEQQQRRRVHACVVRHPERLGMTHAVEQPGRVRV
eukprot:5324828-Prymnesium_polylepis.1